MLVKGNIEIVVAFRANIHVFVFTSTCNNLFSTRIIHLIHTFDFVIKLNCATQGMVHGLYKWVIWWIRKHLVVTLALGWWPRQGVARLQAKRGSQEWKEVWGNEPSHPQGSSHLGSWSPNGLPNVQRTIVGVKTQWIEKLFISLESYWNVDMGSHDPFGHLKHKLWLKERLGIKLTVWLPTTKSRELTRFYYVQMACDILLKSF
jgi:hypothetical protein